MIRGCFSCDGLWPDNIVIKAKPYNIRHTVKTAMFYIVIHGYMYFPPTFSFSLSLSLSFTVWLFVPSLLSYQQNQITIQLLVITTSSPFSLVPFLLLFLFFLLLLLLLLYMHTQVEYTLQERLKPDNVKVIDSVHIWPTTVITEPLLFVSLWQSYLSLLSFFQIELGG